MEGSTLSSFLPTGLLNHFEIKRVYELGNISQKRDELFMELDELNTLPPGYEKDLYESKGFYNKCVVQDFPVRGKAFFLVLRRRRWRLKQDKTQEIKSDYSFICEGSKLTNELSDFLKGTY